MKRIKELGSNNGLPLKCFHYGYFSFSPSTITALKPL